MAAHDHLNQDEFRAHADATRMWHRDQLKSGLDVVSRPGLAVVRLKGGNMVFPSTGPSNDLLPGVPEHGSTVDGMMTGDFRLVNTRTTAVDEGGRNHSLDTKRFYDTDDDVELPRYALTQFMPDPGVLDANEHLPWSMTLHHGRRGSLSKFGNYAGSNNVDTNNEDEFRDYVDQVVAARGRPDPSFNIPVDVARRRRGSSNFGVVSEHSGSDKRAIMLLNPDDGDIAFGGLLPWR